MFKGFGLPSTWTAEVLVTLGDLLVVLTENDLYTVSSVILLSTFTAVTFLFNIVKNLPKTSILSYAKTTLNGQTIT